MDKNKGGRPPLTDEEKEYNKLLKSKLKEMRNASRVNKKVNQDLLAENEIRYHFNKYGLQSSTAAQQASKDPNISGFARAVLGMYGKAFEGDMNAFKLMLKMAGMDIDKLEVDTNGNNTFTLNYKLED